MLEHEHIDVNAIDEFGKTAYHYAAFHCDAEFIEFLVKHGADLTIEDNVGKIADIPTKIVEEMLDGCITIEEKDLHTKYLKKGINPKNIC